MEPLATDSPVIDGPWKRHNDRH